MSLVRGLDVDLLAMAALHGRGFTLQAALAVEVPPPSKDAGITLATIARDRNGAAWVAWAVRQPATRWPAAFRAALELVARELFPEIEVEDRAGGEGRWAA